MKLQEASAIAIAGDWHGDSDYAGDAICHAKELGAEIWWAYRRICALWQVTVLPSHRELAAKCIELESRIAKTTALLEEPSGFTYRDALKALRGES